MTGYHAKMGSPSSGNSTSRSHSRWQLAISSLSASAEDVSKTSLHELRTHVPSYSTVPDHQIQRSVQMNIDASCQALGGRTAVPSLAQRQLIDERVAERVSSGVPIEDVIRGFRVAWSFIRERFVQIGREVGLDSQNILEGAQILWELSDLLMAQASLTYQQLGIDSELVVAARRSAVMEKLLTGIEDVEAIAEDLQGFDLSGGESYVVSISRPEEGGNVEALRRVLEQAYRGPRLVASMGVECVGVSADAPARVTGALTAVGPRVPLGEIPSSYRLAERTLAWMAKRGMSLCDYSTPGWEVLVETETHLTRLFVEQFVSPVGDRGEFGTALLESLRVYLSSGQNVAKAAEELFIHPNTLRYRVQKYQEITGANMSSPDTVVRIAWALSAIQNPRTED